MSTTPRIEYKIEEKDKLANVVIDSYIVEDNTFDHKIINRHVQRYCHKAMVNILHDAMYNYDDSIECNISTNRLKAWINVNGDTRYFIIATRIEIYDDNYRTYRDHGITLIDDKFYLSYTVNDRVMGIIDRNHEIPIDDQYAEIYSQIDKFYTELYQ